MGMFDKLIGSVAIVPTSAQLNDQRNEMAQKERENSANLQLLKNELASYETAGYTAFRNSVLRNERERLATLLIEGFTEDAETRDGRLSVRGQYAQVRHLMNRPDQLRAEIAQTERERYEILTALSDLDAAVKEAKEREA